MVLIHMEENYHQVAFRCINKTNFYIQREDSVTLIRPFHNLKLHSVNTLGCNLLESGDHWLLSFHDLDVFTFHRNVTHHVNIL